MVGRQVPVARVQQLDLFVGVGRLVDSDLSHCICISASVSAHLRQACVCVCVRLSSALLAYLHIVGTLVIEFS